VSVAAKEGDEEIELARLSTELLGLIEVEADEDASETTLSIELLGDALKDILKVEFAHVGRRLRFEGPSLLFDALAGVLLVDPDKDWSRFRTALFLVGSGGDLPAK